MTTPEPSRSTESDARHAPVLVAEVVSILAPRAERRVRGRHGRAGRAHRGAAGGGRRPRDRDRSRRARARIARATGSRRDRDRVEFVHADYRDLPAVLRRPRRGARWPACSWISACRRCSWTTRRADSVFGRAGRSTCGWITSSGPSLADRLAGVDETTLADVIWRFGEERRSRRVARAILAARDRGELDTTLALAVGGAARRRRRRVAADRPGDAHVSGAADLGERRARWAGAVRGRRRSACFSPGGRLAIIAFHSLEDRIVKHTMRRLAAAGAVTLVTRRPTIPGDAEIAANPRARSARLRAVEKVA